MLADVKIKKSCYFFGSLFYLFIRKKTSLVFLHTLFIIFDLTLKDAFFPGDKILFYFILSFHQFFNSTCTANHMLMMMMMLMMTMMFALVFVLALSKQIRPSLDESMMNNITALKGDDVNFRCRVNNLGKHLVSFIFIKSEQFRQMFLALYTH